MKRHNWTGDLCGIVLATGLAATLAAAGTQEYTIVDLGIVDPGDFGSQGFAISEGGVVTGRSLGESNQAFMWTEGGGSVPLPHLPSRPYAVGNGANDNGLIVGTAATTFFGSSPLPILWTDGAVSQLPLPTGETLGRANDINAAGIAVGSVDGGSAEQPVYYTDRTGTKITTAAADGSLMRTAFAINDSNLIVGFGIDPNNAARNVGSVYDLDTDTMTEVGALPGRNGALAFGVSNAGHVVGSSMMNQGSGLPFIWTEADGIQAVPLPPDTGQGSARAVNSDGWVVGNASNAFSIPFLFNGVETVAVADLLPPDSGWDLSMNTSSSALGISEDGIITGTGVHNGDTRAYALIPVPAAACPEDLDGSGDVGASDLAQLLSDWGVCRDCDSDFDGDGTVGAADLAQLLSAWGPCP